MLGDFFAAPPSGSRYFGDYGIIYGHFLLAAVHISYREARDLGDSKSATVWAN